MKFFINQSKLHKLFINILAIYTLVCFLCLSFLQTVSASNVTEGLPVDVDLTVNPTDDVINFDYKGTSYSVQRDCISSGIVTSSNVCFPYTTEHYLTDNNVSGIVPCNYWYSPSFNRVFIISNSINDKDISSYPWRTISYCDGVFHSGFNGYSQGGVYVTYYDCVSGVYTYSGNCAGLGQSNNSYLSQYYDSSASPVDFPDDLLCLYSNYIIDGFYEPTNDDVVLPSYYFQYGYLFYQADIGYIYVDSSSPISYVEYLSRSMMASINFINSSVNHHVYYSFDGITWNDYTSISTISFKAVSVPYKYFWMNTPDDHDTNYDASLIWTNDRDYGQEPIVDPDFENITDITGELDSIIKDYDVVHYSGRGSSYKNIGYICPEYPDDVSVLIALLGYFSYEYCYYCIYDLVGDMVGDEYPMKVPVYVFSDEPPDVVYFYPDYSSSSSFLGFDYLEELVSIPYKLSSFTKIATPLMYFRLMANSLNNIDTSIGALRVDLHSDIKSIFGNISNTNKYLNRLNDYVKDINIPDYSDILASINFKLAHINDDVIPALSGISGNIGSINIPNYSEILSKINSGVAAIPDKMSELFVFDKLFDGFTGLLDDAVSFDDLFDSDKFDLFSLKSFVNFGLTAAASGTFTGLLNFSDHMLTGFSFINGYIVKLYEVNPSFKMVCLVGVGFTAVNIVFRKSKV